MKFVQTILRRPMSVFLLIMAVVVFGSAALTGMPLEYMPDMEMPMELVMVTWPGADADSVDRLLSQPIEDEVQSLSDISSVNTYSYDNYTMVQLTYNYGVDMDEVYSDLKNAMDNLKSDLPSDCGDPTIMELSADYMPTMSLSATAPEGVNVSDYLNDTVVPVVERVSGVAKVEVSGTQEEYLRVVLDEAALRQYKLSISQVAAAIAAADFDMPVGDVTMGTQDITLGAYGNVEIDPDFRDLPIQTPSGETVMLDDISTFFNLYKKDAESVSRYNGADSVMLQITKQDSASTVEVCRDVTDALKQFQGDGFGFDMVYNEGDSVLETLGEVLKTLITGVVLTMLVLLLFFGDWRASLIVGISMPLSILLAVILLNFAGFSIDLMTGTSLIIAIGMIVDNSIVILESCMRSRAKGLTFREAAAEGTSTMLMSILAGTLTTVVVYVPLAMAEGMVGMMSRPLSWTILLTMLCSFLSAIVVVPLAFVLLQPKEKEDLPINRLLEKMRKGYRRIMPGLLKHPGRVVLVGVAAFAAAIALMTQMEFVMMPDNYDGSIELTANFRSGTKLEVMDAKVKQIEDALLADDAFEKVTLSISNDAATFTAYGKDGGKRTSGEAVEIYTDLFNGMAGMDVSVTPTSSDSDMSAMSSSANTKTVTLAADDMTALEQSAGQVEEAMKQIPGVIRISNAFDQSRVKGRLVIDSQKALAAGTSESSVAMQVYYLLNGLTATTVDYGDSEYDVILEYPEGKYDDITSLLDYPISTQSGRMVTLRDIAEVEYITTLPTITRQDGKYTATVTATTTDASKYTASSAIDDAVSQLDFPDGAGIGKSMMEDLQDDEVQHISTALLSAVFLVFLVMGIQFDSPRLSIMVMMCIPLSLIGSIGLVFLAGRPMSLVGLMGFLMLVGIAVNNGIYLVDGTNQLRRTMPLGEALVEAGTTRLRPILMTTLTTCISMVPMMFSNDSGMGMMKDMAYIVVGGLVASTILAMFLMPAFYLVIRRENTDGTKKKGLFRRRRKAEEEPTPAS